MNEATFADGTVTLSPDTPVCVNQQGRWTLTFTAGENGLDLGDIIHIEIPQGFTPPQIENPKAPGFITISEKNTEAHFALSVGRVPGETIEDFNSDTGLYIIIERAPIRNGESFQLTYGAGESQAFAPTFSGNVAFSVRIRTKDNAAETAYLSIRQNPSLTITAQELTHLEIIAPSGGHPGTPLELRVIGRDDIGNRCVGWRGWFRVETDAEGVLIPASQRNEDTTGEGVTLDVGLSDRSQGIVRLRVRESDSDATGLSNPITIGNPAPYWGDLHACLPTETTMRTELDFTLNVGAEPTHQKASFHFQTEEVQDGVGQPSSGFLRFSLPDANSDEMLPSHLLEIYSSWGNRENWGAHRPDIRLDRHPDRTVQAVLAQGIIAGFAAGSNSTYGVGQDARRAEANRGYPAGLTAVFADSLDQDDLFAALRERRCYATTGARILLDVSMNSNPMGRLVEVSADDETTLRERRISARIFGTAPIDRIEVIRNNTEICTYRGDGLDVQFDWVDQQDLTRIALPRNLRGGGLTCYYYLRITQEDGEIAWSSPVWFMLRR
ncbi:MAG: DUF3604 domain-containing protein [Candidatus Latescibacteria bacterium]|jgi:hypothetical protein|nr:DUF3604 domain-containing protein [Candidatus Latescibacterota bacterium]